MNKENSKMPIYFDYQATTPCDERVVEVMTPYWSEKFGNSGSKSHQFGWDADEAVEKARKQIANLINANPKEIIFTSGATESNNLAIKGLANFVKPSGKNHIITIKTEHKCVLESCRQLQEEGFEVTYLDVQKNGLVDLNVLKVAITDKTFLISIMHVNNEIGVIQNIGEIGSLCREKGVKFHSDCAQSFGKIDIDVEEMKIDMLSISGHKIYAPKGIGALYVRRKPRVRIKAILNGGGQERNMRSGTLPIPLIVALGKTAEISKQEMASEQARLLELRNYMWNELKNRIDEIYLNGDEEQRIAGNLNISFAYVEGESMMMAINGLAVSSGSACTSASLEPSYVLKALGVGEDLAHTSIRFGLGRFTTRQEVEQAIEDICKAVKHLREMSPLWEMAQEGIDISKIKWAEH